MNLNKLIDHTFLKPDCRKENVERLCSEAIEHQFRSICIPPYYVRFAAEELQKFDIRVATVIGYPYGYSATASKVEEIKRAIDDGADEIDAVINICSVKEKNWNYLRNDIDSMTRAVHLRGKIIKVILETGMLTEEEILKASEICIESGVNFIKTSTGLHEGASVEIISFLRKFLPNEIKIKASGGIRTRKDAEALVKAGADRIGTSKGVLLADPVIGGLSSDSQKDPGIQFDFD